MGNLVCTAGYDLGEHLRIVVLSTSEGDDKLIKYPAIFQRSDALVITKIDLLPYLNFDVAKARADMKRLAPEARVFRRLGDDGRGPGGMSSSGWPHEAGCCRGGSRLKSLA